MGAAPHVASVGQRVACVGQRVVCLGKCRGQTAASGGLSLHPADVASLVCHRWPTALQLAFLACLVVHQRARQRSRLCTLLLLLALLVVGLLW